MRFAVCRSSCWSAFRARRAKATLNAKVLFHLGKRFPLLFLTGDLRVPNVLTVLKLFDELLVKLDREHDLYPFPLLVDDKAGPERSGLLRGR